MTERNNAILTGGFDFQDFSVELTYKNGGLTKIHAEVFQGMQINEQLTVETIEPSLVSSLPIRMHGVLNEGETTIVYQKNKQGIPTVSGDVGYAGGSALNGKHFHLEEQIRGTYDGRPHCLQGFYHGIPLSVIVQYHHDGSVREVQGYVGDKRFHITSGA